MRCPLTPEHWHEYRETGDPQVAKHLATCARCRNEATQFERLQRMLSALPAIDATAGVQTRMELLNVATTSRRLTCAETLTQLDAWREGELDGTQAFLVDDHLLWCESCAEAYARGEHLATLLRTLPALTAPASIAERIAQARLPWWQRLLPTPAPQWGRVMVAAGSLAAALMVAYTLMQSPVVQIADEPALPGMTMPAPDSTVTPLTPADDAPVVIAPSSPATAQIANTASPMTRPRVIRRVHPAVESHVTSLHNAPVKQPAPTIIAKTPAPAPIKMPVMIAKAPEDTARYEADSTEALIRSAAERDLAEREELMFNAPEKILTASARSRAAELSNVTSVPLAVDSAANRAENLKLLNRALNAAIPMDTQTPTALTLDNHGDERQRRTVSDVRIPIL